MMVPAESEYTFPGGTFCQEDGTSWLSHESIEHLGDLGVYQGTGLAEPVYLLAPSLRQTAHQRVQSIVRASEKKRAIEAMESAQVAQEQLVKPDKGEDNEKNSVDRVKMGAGAKVGAITWKEIVEEAAAKQVARKVAEEAAKEGRDKSQKEEEVKEWYSVVQLASQAMQGERSGAASPLSVMRADTVNALDT
ncbi:hypothetical protein EJ07DRAFT_152044 [Lizonia empirigonia]|nr:hypothetical protein EJ07DRAFT_152044 [Lizonia empirigonia]